MHEYDKLYDVPKVEISTERALEIERQSWNTTKILTEAFIDEQPDIAQPTEPVQSVIDEPTPENFMNTPTAKSGGVYEEIHAIVGSACELIKLCANGAAAMEQRRFAMSHSTSLDELADVINEAAANILGDIILESDGASYVIIEDYKSLFEDL